MSRPHSSNPITTNDIDKKLAAKTPKPLHLMTHIVAGYPSVEVNLQTALIMEKTGVDFIEVQIPFSDPLADGPTIMRANHRALAAGMTPEKSFTFIKTLSQTVSMPIIVMTYYNIPFKVGIDNFLSAATQAGVSGMIIPDIPYDATEPYLELIKNYPVYPIFVVSPQITSLRLKKIASIAQGFIYTTLRIGITGSKTTLPPESLDQFARLKQTLSIPIAAGFGLSAPEQLNSLIHHANIAVIGSKLLDIIENHPSNINGRKNALTDLETFLTECNQTILQSNKTPKSHP
ncbi:tryptophan synthase alpha chain [Spirochaetota bacterium]|nr:tryptophan synthase alpha chain [Spirochaetota bacterium]